MKILLKKFGQFSIGPFVGALLGFITVPLITYFISTAEYGRSSMFTLAQSTMSMVLYLGMDQAFVREFNHEKDRVERLLANAMLLPMCMAFLFSVLLLCFTERVSLLLFDVPYEKLPVYALALMLPFMVLENFGLLKIRMEERGMQYSLYVILLKLLTLCFTVILFLSYEKSFHSVIFATAGAEIITGIVISLTSLRKIPFLRISPDKALLSRMLCFGLPLMPAAILGWALTSMDKLMLRGMCSFSELGLYSAAYKIVSVLGIVQACFTLFWTPVAYRWYEAEKGKECFSAVNRIVSIAMTCLCLIILLCKDIVAFILGKDFAQAIYIFPFIILYPIMYTMSEANAVGIGFARKTQYNILISALSGVINILLNSLLIPILAGKGAAMATGISYIVFFWARTLISRKFWYAFPLKRYIVYSAVILLNCFAHTFAAAWAPYLVSLVCVLALAPEAWGALKECKSTLLEAGEG